MWVTVQHKWLSFNTSVFGVLQCCLSRVPQRFLIHHEAALNSTCSYPASLTYFTSKNWKPFKQLQTYHIYIYVRINISCHHFSPGYLPPSHWGTHVSPARPPCKGKSTRPESSLNPSNGRSSGSFGFLFSHENKNNKQLKKTPLKNSRRFSWRIVVDCKTLTDIRWKLKGGGWLPRILPEPSQVWGRDRNRKDKWLFSQFFAFQFGKIKEELEMGNRFESYTFDCWFCWMFDFWHVELYLICFCPEMTWYPQMDGVL